MKFFELITKQITNEDNSKMELLPTKEEIERVVQELPKENLPRIDGVTTEILKGWWSFMKEA